MSAPATNALSPTPVITINLTSGFDTDDLTAWSISEKVSMFKAFNFFGLLIEIVLTPVSYTHLTLPTNREV